MRLKSLVLICGMLLLGSSLAAADTFGANGSSCTGDFDSNQGVCNLYEGPVETFTIQLNGATGVTSGYVAIGEPELGGAIGDLLYFYSDPASGLDYLTVYSGNTIPAGDWSAYWVGNEDGSGFFSYDVGNVYNLYSDGQVPEPASLVLMGSGLIGLAGRLRKRLSS